MKKEFEMPEVQIISFEVEDIITGSSIYDDETGERG